MGLSLVTRFVTLPMAVPVVEAFGANLGLAAAAVIIQGILGASFGQKILDMIGVCLRCVCACVVSQDILGVSFGQKILDMIDGLPSPRSCNWY